MGERSDGGMPREVRIASSLLIALAAVLIVNAIIAALYRGELEEAAAADVGTLLEPGQLRTLLVVVTILLLALAGLLLLAGIQIRRRRQWARVVAFVAAGILIVLTGVGALAGAGILAVMLLGAAVGVVALLMQSAVSSFFEGDPGVRSNPWS